MIFESMQTAVQPIMKKIKQLDFITQLIDGNLAMAKFIFYIKQDLLYLNDYARALALTGVRATENQHLQQFLQFALGAIDAETALHNDYLKRYQTNNTDKKLSMSPSCFMYNNYLMRTAAITSVEESMSALLPCFWIYHEIGKHIASANTNPDNPYQQWIDLYSGSDFILPTQQMIDIVNTIAQTASTQLHKKMITAFLTASRLEWQFWHSAYHEETWQIDLPILPSQ